ncbi:uncharacterized protein BX664DRAFT_290239 [Halteromyces radiatus]|uniref:uncharacterized protein n=1 Tax=Halteromyces radiatus TaxID=101107 RepID=UPI00221EB304|nr:uncharacterized protein BX664DRAFT_290239 [Halteromyces radiatus]KAI8099864.1 hypothetical protein BX664DRAFT_290239 [Halteromyces radiatus]
MKHSLNYKHVLSFLLLLSILKIFVIADDDTSSLPYTHVQPRAAPNDITVDSTANSTNTPTTTTTTTITTTLTSSLTPSSTTNSTTNVTTPLPLKPATPFHYNQSIVNNTATPNIAYQLNCQVDDPFCRKVENGIVQALLELAKVIDIKTKIIIKIRYHSFCATSSCSNSTFGWGIPSSQFILPFDYGPDLNHVYPQALAKQLVPVYNTSSVWAASDVTVDINHDAYMEGVDYEKAQTIGWNGTGVPPTGRFWFVNDTSYGNNTSIDNNQVDFRYVFLHELLHGLGFISSWAAYFWSSSSPFRLLVENVVDPSQLQIITPGMYWSNDVDGGPIYITGFQPTMIFDKNLFSYNKNGSTTNNGTSLTDLGFDMQNFCVPRTEGFILDFVSKFHQTNQSISATNLWNSMAELDSLLFNFPPAAVANSSYNTNKYLREKYQNMTLLTGAGVLDTPLEHFDQTTNRAGTAISHVDDQYNSTVDFLMTRGFITGQSLEDITQEMYQNIPVIQYNVTSDNNSIITNTYASPIGPGILRILDSMGYSTALTNTSYESTGTRDEKFRSNCDDMNDNSGSKPKVTTAATATSDGKCIYKSLQATWFIGTIMMIFLLLIWNSV